jgi:hypothetical protein
MSFAKNVQKYQKWVLGSIVAVMAVSLVVSFGNFDPGSGEGDKPFATIFDKVTVTEKEWRDARAKAGAWFRLKAVDKVDSGGDYNSMQFQSMLFRYQDRPGLLAWHPDFKPTEDDLLVCAREIVVLGYDARAKQVRATDEEVTAVIRGFLERAQISEEDVDQQHDFTRRYFLADQRDFVDAVRDWILVEKSLTLDVGGSNVLYEQVFNEKLSNSRAVRVLVAGIDGAALPPDLVPISDEQIRAEFETDRASYKMPEKVQIEYLMADIDGFRKKAKDPTPEEIQKYYDENKRQFLKTQGIEPGHSEDDGHNHGAQPDEYKPVDEVREEIIQKIKDQKAASEARTLIMKVNSKDVADRWYKIYAEEKDREPKDAAAVRARVMARTGSIFSEIREQLKLEGFELRNGTTLPVDKSQRDPFTTELGKILPGTANDPLDWAMKAPVGEIRNEVYPSEKGFALLRLDHKYEGYELDLTAPIREKIRKDLERGAAGDRSRRLATDLESRIRANGAAEVARLRARKDVKLQRSTYLAQTTSDSESGLLPVSLAQQVKSRMLKPSGDAGGPEVQVVSGAMLGEDRKDWSYVIVVEDSVQVAPEMKDEEFLGEVRRKETSELSKAKAGRAQELVAQSEWRDATKAAPAQ